jgi:predicted DNA-binding transcriptional regulator YafY
MSKRIFYLRYSLIIKRLQRAPATFVEISEFLTREGELQDFNIEITKRTFQRDLDEIRFLFNVDIQYDFSRKVYTISEDSQNAANHRMLEAFDMFNALNITDDLSNYVYFENRKPKGTEHFYGLLHAAKSHLVIRYSYLKYEDDEITQRVAEPYGLKEFKGRWYLIARDQKDSSIKTFGLDRIQDLVITRKRFDAPKNFNANTLFKNCFGIINPADGKVENIILSFDSFQGKYIKSFPLHETQQLLVDNEKEVRIGLSLHVTHDLVMELLSYGDTVVVIKPTSLRKNLRAIGNATLNHYSE